MTTDAPKLRSGWTTGACAAAAAKAAAEALLLGESPSEASILLPGGQTPIFALEGLERGVGWAMAGVVKDAGDDPDVTHGALIRARVEHGAPGAGVTFRAGEGVGRITKPGLPLPPGEPAINPAPRAMIAAALEAVAARAGAPADFVVEIRVPGGEELARKTWNPRLGILGGISILGTTGIVRPFSCAAWIASIHRGVDVARASGLTHVLGATGATSEAAARAHYGLPETACLDMGDFAGGLLKYLRAHPLPRLTIAGGIGKLTKLAQGALDLHSKRSQVDFDRIAELAGTRGLDPGPLRRANTALEALGLAGPGLAAAVADEARRVALETLRGAPVEVDVMVVDRAGAIVGRAPNGG